MKAYEVIADRVKKIGITVAELSRRTEIDSELLRRSLLGERSIKADELVSLCHELDISISDLVSKRVA